MKCLSGILVLFAWGGMLVGADPAPIVDKNGVEQGMLLHNPYAYVAAMNPAKNTGRFGAHDFRAVPLKLPTGRKTLDDREAMFRFLFRPEVIASEPVRRGFRALGAAGEGVLAAVPEKGVVLTRNFGSDKDGLVESTLNLNLDEKLSMLRGVLTVKNHTAKDCNVKFRPALFALIPELQPVHLVMPRLVTRYRIDGKDVFWRNEFTLLNNDVKHYWWRPKGKNVGDKEASLHKEVIVFDQKQVLPPHHFGLMELRGGAAAIWELDEQENLAELELHWQRDVMWSVPVWSLDMKPGEERTIRFHILMVRGLPRYDNIVNGRIFAFVPEQHTLLLYCAPLKKEERSSVNLTLEDSGGTNLILRRSEMAAASPFVPGRILYRFGTPLVSGKRYPLQMQMDSIRNNSRLVEIKGFVSP